MKLTTIRRTSSLFVAISILTSVGCLVSGPTPEEATAEHDHAVELGDDESMYDPQEGAVGYELSEGEEVVWPGNARLEASFAEILSVGGAPKIVYPERAARYFNSVALIPEESVHRDAAGWAASLDLGGLALTVADHPVSARDAVLLAPGMQPEQIAIFKHYQAQSASGAPSLVYVGLLDPAALPPAPIDGFDVSTEGGWNAAEDCEAQAWAAVAAESLPNLSVVFPPTACSLADCVKTKAAWIRANHDVYRVRQMLELMNSVSDEHRAWLWSQPAVTPGGAPAGEDTALSYWFGDYAKYRFDAIRFAYNRLWSDYHDLDLEGLELDIACRPPLGGDICNTHDPAAHHAVKSNIKLCDRFFDEKGDEDRARLLVHEPLHHVFVPWKDATKRLDPIQDLHTHGHGPLCAADVVTNKGYGIARARELATYKATDGGDCWHKNFAFRNNDTYAYAAKTIGGDVRRGLSKSWPFQFWGPDHENTNYPLEPCEGLMGIDPGDAWSDPFDSCQKVGGEWICPGGSGLGDFELDLTLECPGQWP